MRAVVRGSGSGSAPRGPGGGNLLFPGVSEMSDLPVASRQQLKAFIERIERLEEEKAALAADIRDVYSEAKGTGFDTKVMRQIIRLRKQNASERQEHEALLDTYLAALGMINDPNRSMNEAAE
jgi:uncharacterized protein (UPF0335 family)